MPTLVKVRIRNGHPAEEVDLDALTPKARAFARAISMSFDHQPLGVLVDTGRTLGDNPNHTYMYGTGPEADAKGAEPDHRFLNRIGILHAEAQTETIEWLEYNARYALPFDAWPIAGADTRQRPLAEHIPAEEIAAARKDRCMMREQALTYLADTTDRRIRLGAQAWITLQKAGNAPTPRHYAVGGRMPLWHADDLDAYATRPHGTWTLTQAAEHLGVKPDSARGQLSRWGITSIGRTPGKGGESLYADDQVIAAKQARPGRGARTDLVT